MSQRLFFAGKTRRKSNVPLRYKWELSLRGPKAQNILSPPPPPPVF